MDAPMGEHEAATQALANEVRLLSGQDSVGSLESASPVEDLLAGLRAMMLELDAEGDVVEVSATVQSILGYEPEELKQLDRGAWVHPDDIHKLTEASKKLRETGESSWTIFRARHKNGEWCWLEVGSATPYRTATGEVRLLSFLRDVTLRMRAQEALIESEERYRALTENASDLIAEVDGTGRLLYISPSCIRLLGRKPEDLVGRNLREIPNPASMLPDDRRKLLGVLGGDLDSDHTTEGVEWRFKHPDGSWCWFESKAKSFWRSGNQKGMVVIARDITERVKARQDLLEIEGRYRQVAEDSGDVVSEYDSEGRLLWASPNCQAVLGWTPEEMIGTTPYSGFVHGADAEDSSARFSQSLANEEPVRGARVRVRHRDGSWRWVEITGLPFRNSDGKLRYLSVARDITERIREDEERRRLEQRMVQAQKLEGLGIMAGGVAHDFNNLLTPILGHASLALLDLPEDSPVRARLEAVQRAAHRAAALTHQMLSYSGTGPVMVGHVNLSALVKEIGELIESAAAAKVQIDFRLASVIPATDGDSSQLSQVVMNLITNAIEAVGEHEGKVVIRTGTALPGDVPDDLSYGEIDPGQSYVYFEVQDDGCGMDAETRDRIFDPFFSTKFTGRGLGLAAVLGIVRGHCGAIEIDTKQGRGTRIRVMLPCATSAAPTSGTPASVDEAWRSEGVVLVADDDDSVRELAAETLERCGLSVLHAADGREAVALFEKYADSIRLVLLDRTMPLCSGSQAMREIRELRPDAKVILISGYSHERVLEDFGEAGLSGFVQKPFMPMALQHKVREALGE